jgi:hypothetical protein
MTDKHGQIVRLWPFRPEIRLALRLRYRVWWDCKFLPLLDRLGAVETRRPQARRRGFRLCHRRGSSPKGIGT